MNSSSITIENYYDLHLKKAMVTNNSFKYDQVSAFYKKLGSFKYYQKSLSNANMHLMSYLTPNSFWFYVCSQYFPLNSNSLIDDIDNLDVCLSKLILKFSKKMPTTTHRLLGEIPDLLKIDDFEGDKEDDIDNIIDLYTMYINLVENRNKAIWGNVVKKIKYEKEYILTDFSEPIDLIDRSDLLVDMNYYSKIKSDYLEYLNEKHRLNIMKYNNPSEFIFSFSDELMKTHPDDVVCYVCNSDNDNDQSNLIVFCSACNIAVHQKCYGILVIPSDDWICDVCYYLGSNKCIKTGCLLCPVIGGALKLIHVNPYILKIINKSKQNIQECTILKRSNHLEMTKLLSSSINANIEDNIKANKTQSSKNINSVWIHLSCALSHEEVIIKNYETLSSLYIQNINKYELDCVCYLCNLRGVGLTIKCNREDCGIRFHAECGRMNRLYFSPLKTNNEMMFIFYCFEHTPCRLIENIEFKKEEMKMNIITFSRSIEKCLKIIKETDKSSPISSKLNYSTRTNDSNRRRNQTISQRIIDQVGWLCLKLSNLEVSRGTDLDMLLQALINDVNVDYKMTLDKKKFPWKSIKYKGLNTNQIYSLYRNFITCENDFNQIILRRRKIPIFNHRHLPDVDSLRKLEVISINSSQTFVNNCLSKKRLRLLRGGKEFASCKDKGNPLDLEEKTRSIIKESINPKLRKYIKRKENINDNITRNLSINNSYYKNSSNFDSIQEGIIEISPFRLNSMNNCITDTSEIEHASNIEKAENSLFIIEITERSEESNIFDIVIN